MSEFKQKVYQLTRQIPRGKVASYGQLARLAGKPKAARVVGMIMRTNPDAPQTPCHRVVGSKGDLVGYSGGGVEEKRKLLVEEGVVFKGRQVNLKTSQWQPD